MNHSLFRVGQVEAATAILGLAFHFGYRLQPVAYAHSNQDVVVIQSDDMRFELGYDKYVFQVNDSVSGIYDITVIDDDSVEIGTIQVEGGEFWISFTAEDAGGSAELTINFFDSSTGLNQINGEVAGVLALEADGSYGYVFDESYDWIETIDDTALTLLLDILQDENFQQEFVVMEIITIIVVGGAIVTIVGGVAGTVACLRARAACKRAADAMMNTCKHNCNVAAVQSECSSADENLNCQGCCEDAAATAKDNCGPCGGNAPNAYNFEACLGLITVMCEME